MREPLDVFHGDGASFGAERFDIPEQQIEVDRGRLQVVGVQAPIDVRQRLTAADFVDPLVREAVAGNSKQVN